MQNIDIIQVLEIILRSQNILLVAIKTVDIIQELKRGVYKMTLTEYEENNKYVVVFGISHEPGVMWSSEWKPLHSIFDLRRLKFENDKPRVFEAILEDKPRLSFENITQILQDKFGYGYFKIDENDIIEMITQDQTALDTINDLLASKLIKFPSYTMGEQIELTKEDLEDFFDI